MTPLEIQRPHFSVPFNDHARVGFQAADPGHGIATIPPDPVLTNHLGSVHGGALFTVSEAASGRALIGAVVAFAAEPGWQPSDLKMVVSNAEIRFLKPAKGEVVAKARVLSDPHAWQTALWEQGRVVIDVAVETYSGDVLVAELRVQWHVSRRTYHRGG